MPAKASKDPGAKLDYGFDWSGWLGTDTLTTSTWSATPDELTLSGGDRNDTATSVWVAGGEVGTKYKLTNHVETAQGRIDERSITLTIKEM